MVQDGCISFESIIKAGSVDQHDITVWDLETQYLVRAGFLAMPNNYILAGGMLDECALPYTRNSHDSYDSHVLRREV